MKYLETILGLYGGIPEHISRGSHKPKKKKNMFIVETKMGNDWENCWTINDIPEEFATRPIAQSAIDEFFADIKAEKMEGYSREDYRISKLNKRE